MVAESVDGESIVPSVAQKCESETAKESSKVVTPMSHQGSANRRPLLDRAQTIVGNLSSGSPRYHHASSRPISRSYSQGPREIMIHPNTPIRTWQRLEALRMRKLGVSLPRGFMVANTYGYKPIEEFNSEDKLPPLRREATMSLICQKSQWLTGGHDNGVSPFKTLQKPTCGYFFSFGTNHKKIRHGLSPADVPKWRSLNYTSM